MKKSLLARRIAVVAGLSMASGGAMACDTVYSALQAALAISYANYLNQLASQQQNFPYCFASLVTATPVQQVSSTSVQQMATISNVISTRLSLVRSQQPGSRAALDGTGLAAGGSADKWNAWASYTGDKNTYKVDRLTAGGAVFNVDNINNVSTVSGGADYGIAPSMIVGLSAAFDSAAGYVTPNSLDRTTRSNTSGRGQSLAAYVGWQMDRNWAVDAAIGGGTGKSSPAALTSVNSTRRFVGTNLTYTNWIGNWQLNGKGGYQFGTEQFDNATRGVSLPLTYYTARLGQVRIGADVAYAVNDSVIPFIGVQYVNDVSRNSQRVSQLWDDDSVAVSAGINFISVKNKISGGILYTTETARKFVNHDVWMANVNFRF